MLMFTAVLVTACGDSGGSSGGTGGAGGTSGSGGVIADTFTDAESGLVWVVEGVSGVDWDAAGAHCAGFTLGQETDWRVPTIGELRTLVRSCAVTETSGSCGVTNECSATTCRDDFCEGCSQSELPPQGCFWPAELQGDCGYYWSSDSVSDYTDNAWGVGFNGAHVSSLLKTDTGAVRCVR